jgi:hypothetical protein
MKKQTELKPRDRVRVLHLDQVLTGRVVHLGIKRVHVLVDEPAGVIPVGYDNVMRIDHVKRAQEPAECRDLSEVGHP